MIQNPEGQILAGHSVSAKGGSDYRVFSLKSQQDAASTVFVHRLVAYQKYGISAFEPGVHVRHVDDNSLNNFDHNIVLGSQSDNMMDAPATSRLRKSVHAAKTRRRFSDNEVGAIKADRASGMTYRELMDKWGIPAKSSVNNILKRKYKTKV